jgi:hypothetical protein
LEYGSAAEAEIVWAFLRSLGNSPQCGSAHCVKPHPSTRPIRAFQLLPRRLAARAPPWRCLMWLSQSGAAVRSDHCTAIASSVVRRLTRRRLDTDQEASHVGPIAFVSIIIPVRQYVKAYVDFIDYVDSLQEALIAPEEDECSRFRTITR